MIEKLNNREKIILFLIVCVAIIWVFVSQIIDPLIVDNATLIKAINADSIKYSKLHKIISDKEKFKNEFSKISKLDKPDSTEIVDNSKILKIINEIQKKTGVVLENITPIEPEDLSFYKRIAVKVEIADRMDNMLKFIIELKDTHEKLNLVNLTIISGEGENLRATLTVGRLMASK